MIEKYFKKLNYLAINNAFFTVYSIANKNDDNFSLILKDISSFCKKFSVDLTYQSFLKACIDDFLAQNWVIQKDNILLLTPLGRSILHDFSQEQLAIEIEELGKKDQSLKSYASLLSLCCLNTRTILTGDLTAQEILFQDETLLPDIYGNNSIAEALHKEMGRLLQERLLYPNRETTKILEVGAGTGATTRFLLSLLEQNQIRWEYTFSDITPHFVNLAQTSGHFDSSRFHFMTLDLNKLSELKSKLETYDLIIGTNVLHACADVKKVLKNLTEILKPSGIFIFGEITNPEAYLTYTFGLLKDWWQQTPQSYRFSHSPLIPLANWKDIFHEAGLDDFKSIIPHHTPWQTAFSASKKTKSKLTTDSAVRKLQEGIAAILIRSAEEIDVHNTFAELGIDSLLILTLIGKIHQVFGIKLRASDIFDFPTIAKLASHLNHKGASTPPLVGQNTPSPIHKELPFSVFQPYLNEHQYKGCGMMPVDGWVKLICETLKEKDISFHNMLFLKPFFMEGPEPRKGISIKLLPENAFADRFSGEIYSDQDVYLEFAVRTKIELPKKKIDLYDDPSNSSIVAGSELFASERMKIGESYRTINKVSYSSTGFVCSFNKNWKIPIHFAPFQPYLHSLITCALKFPSFTRKRNFDSFLPSLVTALNISSDLKSEEIHHGIGILKKELDQSYSFDLHLCNEENEILCSLENFQISLYEKISLPEMKTPHLIKQSTDEIAIIGMSGLFGKARNIEEFWKVLETGECLVDNIPEKRRKDFGNCAFKAAYIPEIDTFDHEFFNLSRQEAQSMDPQQRLLLEQSYRAFEDAGYSQKRREKIKHSCGIFIGASSGDYLHHLLSTGQELAAQAFWGNAPSVLSGRLSYYFDFHGPTLTVDTACSSSLAALHLACQSLRSGECSLSLLGGVFLLATDLFHRMASKANMLSPDGLCHTFDQQANGFVPGEAVVALILKPLQKALKDKDKIYGVIQATGMNHDGRTNTLTAPSASAQENLIYDTYKAYDISAKDICYVEAHGTGTALGDPVEVDGLSRAFLRLSGNVPTRCPIGSAKTNLGHTAAAAGLVALVKIILSLGKYKLPPSLHFHKLNNEIDFNRYGFYVVDRLQEWPKIDRPKVCALSSFGFGGTNAHAVIAESPRTNHSPIKPLPISLSWPILLSGHSPEILVQKAEALRTFVGIGIGENTYSIESISYTLACRRDHFLYRFACTAKSREELSEKLSHFLEQRKEGFLLSLNLREKFAFANSLESETSPSWKEILSHYLSPKDPFVIPEDLFLDKVLVPLPFTPFQKFSHWVSSVLQEASFMITPPAWMFEQHALAHGPNMHLLPGMAFIAYIYQNLSLPPPLFT